jgi:hypothetical protein
MKHIHATREDKTLLTAVISQASDINNTFACTTGLIYLPLVV